MNFRIILLKHYHFEVLDLEHIREFKCNYEESEEIPYSIIKDTGLRFPEVHNSAESMALLALELKKYHHDCIAKVPFCSTVEAEALGGIINLGDERFGPRIKAFAYRDMGELMEIADINYNIGRISQVLKSINILKNSCETSALCIDGPFTIMAAILEPAIFYKALLRDRINSESILNKVEDVIVNYAAEGIKRGSDIISYGDPAGSLDIVGPKFYREFSGPSTNRILKRIEPLLKGSVLHVCGRTSTALTTFGFADMKTEFVSKDMTYGQGIKEILRCRKDIKLIGNSCIKRTPFNIPGGTIWQVILH